MAKEAKQPTLEENFASIEEIIAGLEEEDISLEDAFRAYEKGMALLKTCNDQLDRVEKQVLVLNEQGEAEEF